MFFKKNRSKKKAEAPENPYLNARKQWNFIMGDMISAKRMWQFIGLASLLINLVAVAGLIYIGSQSKFIPYIVEVDKLGESVTVGRADQASPVDDRITKATLANLIVHARTITTDAALQRKYILDLYSKINAKDPAAIKMNEWFKTSPFKRAESTLVNVEVKSVLKQSDSTWQIDWIETTRTHDGNLAKPAEQMRGLFNIYFEPPEDEAKILANPTGLYVKDFSWAIAQ